MLQSIAITVFFELCFFYLIQKKERFKLFISILVEKKYYSNSFIRMNSSDITFNISCNIDIRRKKQDFIFIFHAFYKIQIIISRFFKF